MQLRGLSEVILEEPDIDEGDEQALEEDAAKCAELVQYLDDKSLSIVM